MRLAPIARVALALAVTLALAGGVRAAEDFQKIEADIAAERAKVVQAWLSLAADLSARDLKDAALDAIARARALDPEVKGLAEAAARAEALAGRGTPDDASAKRIEKARREAAKGYEKMAAVLAKESQDARHAEWLVAALGLESTKARVKTLATMAQRDGGLVVRAPAHPFAANVWLPPSWRPGKEWPVLVCVDGAGAYFEASVRHFADARGPREWIIVAPHALSSSEEVMFDRYRPYGEKLVREWNGRRLEFDEPGLLGLLDFLREHFGASARVSVTGYGKGALLAYRLAFRHPERLRHVVLACPAFDPALVGGGTPATDGGAPVVALVAEQDPARATVEAQADAAAAELAKLGWRSVARRIVAGVGCSDLPGEVWAVVAP